MREKLKKVYYCDFCKKKGLSGGHIAKHEKYCTMNPDRECRMCKDDKVNLPEIVAKVKSLMSYKEIKTSDILERQDIKQPTIEDIKKLLPNYECPACILATIRQSGINKFPFYIEFDYKKQLEGWWTQVNSDQREQDEIY